MRLIGLAVALALSAFLTPLVSEPQQQAGKVGGVPFDVKKMQDAASGRPSGSNRHANVPHH